MNQPARTPPTAAALHSARSFSRLVKLSHTVFGLPFALAAALLAHRAALAHDQPGLTWGRLALVVLAFTAARTAAMAFNRIVDRHIDAENPRTRDRELPRGVLSVRVAWLFTAAAVLVFLACAVALGPIPAVMAGPCLLVVFAYSLFKRFSWSSHLMLGVALSLAPGGAFVAITGGFDGWPVPVAMMVAVATWVAGFDVLYSTADLEFDRRRGLHSIPARFGLRGALTISALLHVGTAAALVGLHVVAGLGVAHLAGVLLVVVILVYEHWIVRPDDLSRLGKAFFDLNGYVSIGYLAAVVVDVLAG